MKHLFHTLNRICDSKWFIILFIPISSFFLLLYSTTTSPIYQEEGCDSLIFKTMGLAILQGKTPYLDYFDHKGPILYLLNALGQWLISGRCGIFILQIISLSVFVLYLYKLACLFISSSLSFVLVLVSLGILGVFFEGGNLTEEWNLPFLIIPLYYSISYFCNGINSPHPIKYSLIYGLCFGFAFFIRPNDAVAQIGGVIVGVSLWLLYQKNYHNMIHSILFFILGFFIVAIPILIWFEWKNAFGDLFHGLIRFNANYTGGIIQQIWSVFMKEKIIIFLLFFVLAVMIFNTTYKRLLVLMIPVLTFVVILFGTRNYPHYNIVLVPYYLLFFVFLFLQQNKSILVCAIAMIYASQIDVFRDARKIPISKTKYLIEIIHYGKQNNSFYEETNRLLKYVPLKERNQIWNYNLDFNAKMLWHEGLVQSNRVPLFSMYRIDHTLKEMDDIVTEKPQYLLFNEQGDRDPLDHEYILNNYDRIAQTDSSVCNIVLYQRK